MVKSEKNIKIHPSSIINSQAILEEGVEIGPFSIIGKNVKIGKNTKIHSSVLIDGWTTIGENCDIYTGTIIGTPPQDLKYKGEKTYVIIGNNNIIREYVTIHRSSGKENKTLIGSNNLIMAYVHIAHNCIIGNQIVIANSCGLSGHVEIHNQSIIGGFVGIHQFVKIGKLAMIGGYSKIVKDIPPFAIADGQPAKLYGINAIGLKRKGISLQERNNLKRAYKLLCHSNLNLSQAINAIQLEINPTNEINELINFLKNPSKMGILIN